MNENEMVMQKEKCVLACRMDIEIENAWEKVNGKTRRNRADEKKKTNDKP